MSLLPLSFSPNWVSGCIIPGHLKGLCLLGMCWNTTMNLLKLIPKKQTKYSEVFPLLKKIQEEDQENTTLCCRRDDFSQRKDTQRVTSQCTTTKEIVTSKAPDKINLPNWSANTNLKTGAQFFSLSRGYTDGCSNTSEQMTKRISKTAKIKGSPTIIKSLHYILSPRSYFSGCLNKLTYKNTCPINFLPAHQQNGQCPSSFWSTFNRSLLRFQKLLQYGN